jgi:hypothetical protein
MKRILLFVFLLTEFVASGQTKPSYFTPVATPYEWTWGRFKYGLRPPTDTLPTADSGSIAYKNGVWYGKINYWSALGGGGGASDSSLFATRYWTNSTFQPAGDYVTNSLLSANHYTKTQINSFFGGTTTIGGYNKANWDAVYASWSAAQALSPAGWATQRALVDTAAAIRSSLIGGGGGVGDMTKAVYDANNNGLVDALELTGVLIGNNTSTPTAITGTANQILRRNAANTAYEFYTPSYQAPLSGTGLVKSVGGTISYISDFSSDWNTAFGWGNHASAGYESQTNKSTSTSLGTSNTLYPSQLAVKTYVDNAVSGVTPSLTQYRLAIGGAGNVLTTNAAITGNRALVSDANGVPTHSATTATQLGYLSTTTSDVQTQINSNRDSVRKRYLGIRAINDTMFALQKWNGTAITEDTVVISLANGDKGDITVNNGWTNWTIDNGAVTNVKLASGIDAAKIADGSVSNAEYQYLNSVTSNVQTQIDSKQATLVSGTNIKTVNGTSLLGSGNITISGGTSTSSGTFKEIRFKWGVTTNAPASGDSVLQHDTLIGKDIEVYREGELQDSTSQYIFNGTTGTITFRPAEFTGERNTIKVYPSGTRTSVALTAPASFATTNRVALYTNTSKTVVGTDVTKWANADGNTALDYSQSDSGYPQDGGSNGLTFDGIAARKLYMTSIPTTQSAPITIYMRVKVNAFPSALFAPSGSAYGVFFDVSNTYFNPAGSGYGVVTSGISSATWHTVVITWDGSTANKVYVDGTLLGTAGGSPSGSALDFAILNAQSAGTYFNGNVLGLAIFSVVHDATTVATQTPLFNTVVQ